MEVPVDVKAVLDAVADTEQARSRAVRVHVYLDPTAPDDLMNTVVGAFKTSAPHATVIVDPYPTDGRMPDALADMAVVVAAYAPDTGMLVADLRSLSTPALVVTSLPQTVRALAEESKYPLMPEDLVAPPVPEAPQDPDATALLAEPVALTVEDAAHTREAMGSWIVDVFPDSRLAFAAAFPFVRRPLSLEAVQATAIQNAGIGLVVILPGVDMPIMTLNQMKMLLQIAAAYGEPLTLARAKEMLAVVGGAFGCRAVARQLVSVFPGIGWAIKAGIGYGGTVAMGRVLIEYFECGGDLGQMANRTAQATEGVAPSLGVTPEASPQENLRNAAQSLSAKAKHAAVVASHTAVPFAKAVLGAAGEATGFSRQDVADLGKAVASNVVGAVGKARA